MIKNIFLYYFLICFNSYGANYAELKAAQDDQGVFYNEVIQTSKSIKKILKTYDFLNNGDDDIKPVFSGVEKKFLITISGKTYILTMLKFGEKEDALSGGVFHLRKAKFIDQRIYVSDWKFVRIFKDLKLWNKLNKK